MTDSMSSREILDREILYHWLIKRKTVIQINKETRLSFGRITSILENSLLSEEERKRLTKEIEEFKVARRREEVERKIVLKEKSKKRNLREEFEKKYRSLT